MPRGNRTGPLGLGPRTGRGLGYCATFDTPDYSKPVYGWGMAWGAGFGWRHRAYIPRLTPWGIPRYAPPTKAETLQALQSEADWLKEQLNAVQQKIDELEKESTT